jgi:hypothetical protein
VLAVAVKATVMVVVLVEEVVPPCTRTLCPETLPTQLLAPVESVTVLKVRFM